MMTIQFIACSLCWDRANLLPVLLLLACGSIAIADDPPSSPLQARTATIRTDMESKYWLYLPDGYDSSQKTYPLILFLHGGGESGDDLELVKKHGLPKELFAGRKLPCIVLAPQNPDRDRLWDDRLLDAILNDRLDELRVDRSRLYLAGLSRGGHGVYRLVVQHPQRFAAVAMMCGGGPVAYASRCKQTPFWFFHGDRDPVVPLEESQRLANAIRASGGEARLTLYADTGHDCWSRAFADDELYKWLLSQQRPTARNE